MPLSPSVEREPIHTRTVVCRGFRRADGLWDIEGHLTDIKSYDFESQFRGTVTSGTPVHQMWLRLTVDDREQTDRLFGRLAAGGNITTPLGIQPWGDYYGKLTDRFGVQWMLLFPIASRSN